MASERDTIRSIREEWKTETGEDPGDTVASVYLDRMCDAFFHAAQGAGYDYAVRQDMRTAEYLATRWKGEERTALREAIARVKAGAPAELS